MSAVSDRLDAIQARLDAAAPGAITITPSDVAWLRDTARKQQAALDAVRALVDEWIEKAGPGSNAERAFGRQVVSVEFAAKSILQALEAKP